MLKRLAQRIAMLLCLAWAIPAAAWWSGFYTPPAAYGGPVFWTAPQMWGGLVVEQMPTPQGYSIRIFTGNQRAEDVMISAWGGQLLIRTGGVQTSQVPASGMTFWQTGGSTQWVALPEDADWSRMTLAARGAIIEVFVPRRY